MHIHLVSGFLGSGKSTAIQTACKALQNEDIKAAVITNDQGIKLVDTGYFESASIPNRQVINGCFCCNYNSLDANIQSLIQTNNPDLIFAESVGSCTDIVATVMKPLLRFRKNVHVSVTTFADVRLLHMLFAENKQLFNNEVNYIYTKQLEEAEVIAVSKIDLINKEELENIKQLLQSKYPDKEIIYINGTNSKDVSKWLTAADKSTKQINTSSLNIDYKIYGEGEADLAWLDAELKIYSNANKAEEDAVNFTSTVYNSIQTEGFIIGHLKFLIDEHIKISYTTAKQNAEIIQTRESLSASVLLNARLQTTPELLKQLIIKSIRLAEVNNNCTIMIESLSAFKPGYPTPTYRIAD